MMSSDIFASRAQLLVTHTLKTYADFQVKCSHGSSTNKTMQYEYTLHSPTRLPQIVWSTNHQIGISVFLSLHVTCLTTCHLNASRCSFFKSVPLEVFDQSSNNCCFCLGNCVLYVFEKSKSNCISLRLFQGQHVCFFPSQLSFF